MTHTKHIITVEKIDGMRNSGIMAKYRWFRQFGEIRNNIEFNSFDGSR